VIALEARRDPELAEDITELYDAYIAATRESLTAVGIDADETFTRLIFAALDGLSFQQLVYGKNAKTDACVAELRALLASRAKRT
jgi:hypothetical protein